MPDATHELVHPAASSCTFFTKGNTAEISTAFLRLDTIHTILAPAGLAAHFLAVDQPRVSLAIAQIDISFGYLMPLPADNILA